MFVGIIFDARKYGTKEPEELVNGDKISSIRKNVVDALNGSSPSYSYKAKKNFILVKANRRENDISSESNAVKSIKIRGSFENFNAFKKKTWKSARIDSIAYSGFDGKIAVKGVSRSDSLGTLGMWGNLSGQRFASNLFKGDDIIYSPQKDRTNHRLRGYGGDDTFFLYGAEEVYCDQGAERVIITRKALQYLGGPECMGIWIRKASLLDGDTVEISGRDDSMTLNQYGASAAYSLVSNNDRCGESVAIDAVKGGIVYADFF